MANTVKRATARRKAEAAIAQRAEEFHRHETSLREIIADYFEASERAENVRADAKAKTTKARNQADEHIARIQQQAENDAAGYEHQAGAAVARMLEIGETPKSIADALGITLARVRDIQRPVTKPGKNTPRAE